MFVNDENTLKLEVAMVVLSEHTKGTKIYTLKVRVIQQSHDKCFKICELQSTMSVKAFPL